MRKKTLTAFAAVYAVLCLTYGTVSGLRQTSGPETQTAAVVVSEPGTTQPEEEIIPAGRRKKHGKRNAGAAPEEEEKQQTEAAADGTPTLEEYLGKLRCGGCGHGCFLLNPRCMRGARKQGSAASEYQTLYG